MIAFGKFHLSSSFDLAYMIGLLISLALVWQKTEVEQQKSSEACFQTRSESIVTLY
jgi:hypothetical protein